MEKALVALSNELAAAVEQAGRAVVAVHGRPRISSSGFVWSPGIVVTADHTLRRDDGIRVTLADGRTVPAEIAGRDGGTDLAVLKTETGDAPALDGGGQAELRPGNLALVVGRSKETGVTATLGVISSLSGPWHTWRGGRIDEFVRLDAGVYPGLSGGAVVDVNGRFVGLATLGLSRTSPLAIPVSTIRRVGTVLLEKGHVARGFLGVGLQPVGLPPHLGIAATSGLIVLSVEPDAPAGQAGVGIGDVFVALDGKPVTDTDDVQAVLSAENVGKPVKASILRGGALIDLTITVGERPRRRA
jgi:S1-C subfamily serine protease